MSRVEKGDGWELRLGRWQDVIADVECDAVITDPPYSERTHKGQRHGRRDERYAGSWVTTKGLEYESWGAADVGHAAVSWAKMSCGWICIHTSHDLCPAWEAELLAQDRYVFAPVPIVLRGMTVRLAGDGPSSESVQMVVARPRRGDEFPRWGTLPGHYYGTAGAGPDRAKLAVRGAKPLWLMRAIVRDYSRPGDLVCDPCAGAGTTLLAAITEGRRAIGAECDPATFELAVKRLRKGHTRSLFTEAPKVAPAETGDLFGGDS